MRSQIFEIPLLEPDSFLTIDVGTDLPEDPTEVCQLLADERCAGKWWIAIASAYVQKRALDSAVEVISTGLDKSAVLETEGDRAPFLTMLSWLYMQKMRETPVVSKKEQFDKSLEFANQGFNAYQQSGKSTISDIPAALAQGVLVAAVGNFNDALQPFQRVLAAQPQNVYAKLGRARILYHRKNYRGALRLYQEVLRQTPHLPGAANPRVGIGLCFWQLRDQLKARVAWERVISMEPENEDGTESPGEAFAKAAAHACLGIWFLDAAHHGQRADFETNYVQSMTHFQKAYQGNQIPQPALKIASYLFSKHDMAKVGKLTDKVLETATLPELLGEALFWKARAAHYAGDLDTALTLYTQATGADPENVAAAIGKGIVELSQDRTPEALLTFELVVQSHPKNTDALFFCGLFGALKGGEIASVKARTMLESYATLIKANPHQKVRPEALVALSQLWEQLDRKKSYEYLKLALVQLPSPPLSFKLNLGVLAFEIREFAEAKKLFSEVLGAEESSEETTNYKNVAKFNLACVHEALNELKEAEELYSELSIVEAKARLLLMSVKEDTEVTDELRLQAKSILDSDPQNLELRALYAWCLHYLVSRGPKETSKQAAELEQDFHKQTLSTIDKRDTYSLVAMGNIYLSNAQTHPKSEVAKRQRAYMRAGEFFEKALQLDNNNAYAAQGVAIALAETKRSELALPILSRVRETLNQDANAYMNNAHCYMDVGDYTRATDMYGQAYDKDPQNKALLTLLGRAWFARGSRTKDTEALSLAVDWTCKARDAQPDAKALQFNAAYVQLQYADVLRRKLHEQRSLAQLEAALHGVESAVTALKSFVETPGDLQFNKSDLEDRLDQAESTLLPQLIQAIDSQREHERKAEEKREEAQRQREEEIQKQREARQALQREKEERELKLAEERQRLQAQTAEWEAELAAEREQQQAAQNEPDDKKKKRKGGRRGNLEDLVDDTEVPQLPDTESEDEREFAKEKPDAEFGSDTDPSEKVSRKRNVVDDDDDDNDDEVEQKDGSTAANDDNHAEKDNIDDLF